MKLFCTTTLLLCLTGLTACSDNAISTPQNKVMQPSARTQARFIESRQIASAWETSPQMKAWVCEPGIGAAQQEARIQVAQTLSKFSTARDTLVYISRGVNLSGSAITSLPDGLVVSGTLNLSRSAVEKLDTRLVVQGDLNIEYTTISAIAPCVRVDKALIANNTAFTALTSPINVGGDVYLNHTPLTQLADDLSFHAGLMLRGTPLTTVPKNLRVGGNLDITHCPIDALPDDLRVAGDLIASGTRLSEVPPQSLLAADDAVHPAVRTIDLRDTDISYDAQAYLRLQERTDMQVLLGSRYGALAKAPPDEARFVLDDYVAAYRSRLAPNPKYQSIHLAAWRLSTDQTAVFHALLRNLYETPGGDAGPMAERILDLLAPLQTDVGPRQDVVAILGDTPCTSSETAVALLEKAELAALVSQMGLRVSSDAEARQIGVRMLHLQTVHRFAGEAAKRYNIQDVRRAEQTFKVSLRRALLLPTLPKAPIGPLCSVISDADLQHAADAALRASEEPATLGTFLQTFAPYQRFLRRQLAERATYAAYQDYEAVSIGDAQMLCPLTNTTLADLGEPVTVDQPGAQNAEAKPYEFAALLQWWWQTGTVPLTDAPMDLSSIRPVQTGAPASMP